MKRGTMQSKVICHLGDETNFATAFPKRDKREDWKVVIVTQISERTNKLTEGLAGNKENREISIIFWLIQLKKPHLKAK